MLRGNDGQSIFLSSIDEAIRMATRTGRPNGPKTFAVGLDERLNQS